MRKWNPFTGISETKSSKLHLTICALEGLSVEEIKFKENYSMKVLIEWRTPMKSYLSRRTGEKNHTSTRCINSDGCVHWNESFEHNLKMKLKDYKSTRHWKINLELQGLDGESNSQPSVLAELKVHTAEFAGLTESSDKTVGLPIKCCISGSTVEARLIIRVKLSFPEVQTHQINGTVHPISPIRLLPSLSACVSFQTQSMTRTMTQTTNNIDDSSLESDEDDAEQTYRSITATNIQIAGLVDDEVKHVKDKSWEEDQPFSYQETHKPSLISLKSWNSRRFGFRVRDHPRGTPLLNKAFGEGGDDIDNARRCLSSSFGPRETQVKHDFHTSGFTGSDRFEVGSWEKRKFASRDGKLELVTEMFLASIDQRSDKASGEGACTVLAAVIADWLHHNPKLLPLKCQFDKLIRDGSLEWRNLCKEETHREKFSDKHFDLDTVLQAQVRPLPMQRGDS